MTPSGDAKIIGCKRLYEDIVTRIVRSPLYRGYLYYSGQEFKGGHEPIVDEEMWARANSAIGRGDEPETVKFKDDHVHLPKGLLVCGTCGNHMTPYPSGKKDRNGKPYLYYTCTSVTRDGKESPCDVRALPARAFENLVTRVLADLGNSPAILEECLRQANGDAGRVVEDMETLRQSHLTRLGEISKGIRRIIEYVKTNDGVPEDMTSELKELDRERDQIGRSIEKMDMEIAYPKKKVLDADLIRQQIQHFEHLVKVLPLEDEKELFQVLLKQVQVYPFGPGDDEESDAVVAKVRGRLYKLDVNLHQLLGVGTLPSLNGKSSDNSKLGSPGRARTSATRTSTAGSSPLHSTGGRSRRS